MNNIEQIQNNESYKQILKDSYGGVLYNVDNRDRYDTTTILALWNGMTPADQESVGGIMKGAIDFLQGAI